MKMSPPKYSKIIIISISHLSKVSKEIPDYGSNGFPQNTGFSNYRTLFFEQRTSRAKRAATSS